MTTEGNANTGGETAYENDLKSKLEERDKELAELRARCTMHDNKIKESIVSMQPEALKHVNELMMDVDDATKHDLKSTAHLLETCHRSGNLEQAASMTRSWVCASAQYKRARCDADRLGERTTALADACKNLEESQKKVEVQEEKITGLEKHAEDLQKQNAILMEQIAKAGLLKESTNFSSICAREANADAPMPMLQSTAVLASKDAHSQQQKPTSSTPALPQDDLFAYLSLSSHRSSIIGPGDISNVCFN